MRYHLCVEQTVVSTNATKEKEEQNRIERERKNDAWKGGWRDGGGSNSGLKEEFIGETDGDVVLEGECEWIQRQIYDPKMA